ncbi:MAG TPA: hypothetical protein VF163_02560 [Micromonosporaceae bacterium]
MITGSSHAEQTNRAIRRRLHRPAGLVAVGAALLLALAACGGDSAGGAPGGGDGGMFGDEPAIEASFDISGDVTLKESVTTILPRNKDGSKAATCEEYAKGFKTGERTVLDLPNFITDSKVGGHSLILDGRVSHYNGPGTYSESELSGTGNPIGFSIDGHALVAKEGANVSVTVNADGSGTFAFAELTETSTGITNPQSITGKLTWTCKNP